ncbi:MAG: transporter substrate-binding domain-containing protein [Verrucomicrobia bacterium]|nr:transporter substrate-binding domain-containing protein [Verrucomicrobiota bacterium]
MRLSFRLAAVSLLTWTWTGAAQTSLTSGGTLRAVYLSSNPAHAVKDPATGEIRGAAVDLARELARRLKVEPVLTGVQSPQAAIDAVQNGKADIGFVAYNPERAGPVEFSRPYMLVQQTFLVRQDSAIRSVKDIDRPNQSIGAGRGDSIALYLGRTLKQARLIEVTEASPGEAIQTLLAGKLDAWGANRQRLTDAMRNLSGVRLLPDDLYGVEQTIIVAKGNPEGLKAVNQFIDDVRRSGFLRAAIERSGVIGIAVAPPDSK